MIGTSFKRLLLPIATACLTACEQRAVVVQSTTSWSGSIGNATQEGAGNARFPITGSGILCWAVQKNTLQGTLTVFGESKGLLFSSKSGKATTNASYGVVTGCIE
jgi:hypothetical protein